MTLLDHSSLAFLNLHLTKGPRRSGPSLVPKAKVSPQLRHYGDELFEDSPTDLDAISAARATARTTNLTVILFGAGLTTVLIYALTSELFSKNSPTVLYNEACERIKSSPRVCDHALDSYYVLNRTCAGSEISAGIIGVS
jgi:hypothetical protein